MESRSPRHSVPKKERGSPCTLLIDISSSSTQSHQSSTISRPSCNDLAISSLDLARLSAKPKNTDFQMGWKLGSFKPQMQIYYWEKLLGLAPFSLKNNIVHPANFLDKLYPLAFVGIYLLLALTPFFTQAGFVRGGPSLFTTNGTAFHYGLSGTVTLFIVINFHMKSENVVCLMNKLSSLDEELRNFGIEEDVEKLFSNVFLGTATANLVIGGICLITGLLEPSWPFQVSIAYSIQECVRLNTILAFAQILLCIGRRFVLLNKKLYDICQLPRHVGSPLKLETLMVHKLRGESKREMHMGMVEALYAELCELVDQTTRLFAAPIFLIIISSCCELLVSNYWMPFVLLNKSHHEAGRHVPFNNTQVTYPLLRMAILTIELIIIANAAATTCQQGNMIKTVLFKVWRKFAPTDLTDEFSIFSLHLLRMPVAVSAYGFFDLGYSFVFKIFYATTSYFIIMVQLETSKLNIDT